MSEQTITTTWGYGDFMPNPHHTIRVHTKDNQAYCLRCGDEVVWKDSNGMAPPNLVHTTKRHEECRDCYTPRLGDMPVQPADGEILRAGKRH